MTTTTEPKANRYTITFESATTSGERFVLATSPEEALAKFDESYTEHGDKVPSRWISQTWAVDAS